MSNLNYQVFSLTIELLHKTPENGMDPQDETTKPPTTIWSTTGFLQYLDIITLNNFVQIYVVVGQGSNNQSWLFMRQYLTERESTPVQIPHYSMFYVMFTLPMPVVSSLRDGGENWLSLGHFSSARISGKL